MFFNYVSGIQEIDRNKVSISHREAIRAVILKDDKVLMVHNSKDDYKFPGGGVNKGESHEETLCREVKEETGYIIAIVKEKLGIFTERNVDRYNVNSIFEMTSAYYLCDISSDIMEQELDKYEEELEFKPVWISLDEAIKVNEEVLERAAKDRNNWVERETKVLKAIRENRTLC